MSNDPYQGSEEYERLREAIDAYVTSGKAGEPMGHVVGWVLVVNEQDLASRAEQLLTVCAPWQSRAMSQGILQWGAEELPATYSSWVDGEEDE